MRQHLNPFAEASMEHHSARLKGQPLADAPATEPMRPAVSGQIARKPSTDQKRVRREMQRSRTATVLNAQAWQLNPGDQIRMPNGQTQRVTRKPRPHETAMATHVYVDTDGGTALVKRSDPFTVVPHNSQQQSLPGYGTPGGNSNTQPWQSGQGGSNAAPVGGGGKCGQCGTGSLQRHGDSYLCTRCGYTERFGGAGGHVFTDNPRVVRTFSTINGPLRSAVAASAAALLNTKENDQ